MKITQIILEANVFRKLEKDPLKMKMLSIAMKHDGTLPIATMGRLGPRPSVEEYAKAWSEMLDDALANAPTGNYSRDGKFDDWLTKLYIDQDFDWEDLSGQAIDALATWKALSNRNVLKPEDKDFNKFRSLRILQQVVRRPEYQDEVKRWKEAAQIEKMKASREDTVLIDNDRFFVAVPYNYGACYYVGHIGGGMIPTWCTSSSSGAHWAKRYIDQGLMFNVLDKKNMNDKEGKYQVHAVTSQIKNGDQSENSDELFSKNFPGLMKKIVASIKSHASEIEEKSKKETGKPYDINKEIELIKQKFPLSWASVPPEGEEEAEVDSAEKQGAGAGDDEEDAVATMMARRGAAQGEVPASRGGRPEDIPQARQPEAQPAGDPNGDGPGQYRLTFNGRSVTREFQGRDDARQQLLARNPNIDIDAVEIVKVG
jgi:hypothetical protein